MLLAATALISVVVIAVLCGMQFQAHQQLRGQSDILQEQFKRLAQLEVENVRLSNIVAQANTPLSEVQLAELASLREQVDALHRQTNQLQYLRGEITRLRTALSSVRNSVASNSVADVPPEDIYPREEWKFAGYDTPEDTIQSLAWAISEGDQDSYMNGMTPELQDQMQSDFADSDFSDEGPMQMSDTTGFRILDREIISDNEVIYTLHMDGEEDEIPILLQKVGDEWKISGEGEP